MRVPESNVIFHMAIAGCWSHQDRLFHSIARRVVQYRCINSLRCRTRLRKGCITCPLCQATILNACNTYKCALACKYVGWRPASAGWIEAYVIQVGLLPPGCALAPGNGHTAHMEPHNLRAKKALFLAFSDDSYFFPLGSSFKRFYD